MGDDLTLVYFIEDQRTKGCFADRLELAVDKKPKQKKTSNPNQVTRWGLIDKRSGELYGTLYASRASARDAARYTNCWKVTKIKITIEPA